MSSHPQRPRKVGAKFSNKDICPDERVQPDLSFSYDAKRDRWNGYNPDDHQHVIEEYEKVEVAKRQLKADKLQSELLSGQLSESSIKVGGGWSGQGAAGDSSGVYVCTCTSLARLA